MDDIKPPFIVASMTDIDVLQLDAGRLLYADVVELRIDLFNCIDDQHICNIFQTAQAKFNKPILATARSTKEGGTCDIPDRVSVYKSVVNYVFFFDIETHSNRAEIQAIKDICLFNNQKLILSYHNFSAIPAEIEIINIVKKAFDYGADIAKIAVNCSSINDAYTIYSLTLRHRDNNVIFLGMGEFGLQTRITAPLCGSMMTYGYVSRPTAPGQMSIDELYSVFKTIKLR